MAKKRRRKSTARKRTTRKRTTRKKTVSRAKKPKAAPKSKDLGAMYLSILIVGIIGIILLFANPTEMMRKVIGILLIILGLWGLIAKKK